MLFLRGRELETGKGGAVLSGRMEGGGLHRCQRGVEQEASRHGHAPYPPGPGHAKLGRHVVAQRPGASEPNLAQ